MAHSFSQVYLHIVFSTKHRYPFLDDKEVRRRTHAYLATLCRDLGSPALKVGGTFDHVHILCRMSRTLEMADLVRDVKRKSSSWIKGVAERLSGFYWQQGYAVFSVCPFHLEIVSHYIENQEEHHKTEAFQDEYRRLLDEHGIEYDERYMWE